MPLKDEQCVPQVAKLSLDEINMLLSQIPEWQVKAGELVRVFSFKDYHANMAFVNAVAWIAHQQDHHPNMLVGYNNCAVHYATHSVGGLSRNDFICAAKVSSLLGIK